MYAERNKKSVRIANSKQKVSMRRQITNNNNEIYLVVMNGGVCFSLVLQLLTRVVSIFISFPFEKKNMECGKVPRAMESGKSRGIIVWIKKHMDFSNKSMGIK